ncbi:MAG: glycosyltransferase family 2 protein, partial [Candidatus Lokiarchaeota archaeon]
MTTTKSIPLKNLDDNYKARINQEIADLCDKNRTYKECIEMVDKKFRVAITRYDITKVTRGKDFKTYKKELIATDQSTKKIITKSTFKILLVITSILLGMGCIGFLILRVLMLPLIYPIFYWLAFFTTILIIFTILFTLKWYSKIRKSFSSPLKDTKISAVVIVIFIIIIVGVIQILLSIFRRELIYQISFVLLITSLIFQGTRTITTVSVSVIHKKIHKKLKTRLLVSIILPAYNEAKVIESTIYSLLRLSYQPKEIIVIDDGSTDATPKIVSDIARQESIIVISKPNEGKWSALNKGIQVAQGEIIICIDADTILDKGAIEYLIPYFQDKRIAAVAGNIKVGNRDSKLTKIQALEYVLGLNLQRRSESTLGKVTVVPGPLGAFRKS